MFKHNKTNHIEQRRLPVLCHDVEREAPGAVHRAPRLQLILVKKRYGKESIPH